MDYDPLMRLESIDGSDPGGNPVMTYDYDYDKMDNVTSKDTGDGAYAYIYDDLYRLVDVDNPVTTDEGFTYDAVGNRLSDENVPGAWTYNANNELTGYDETSFSYDDAGNLIQKTVAGITTNYVYNTEGRLKEVRDGSGSLTASYYYDPFGRRFWKDVGGTRTYFHYSDEGLVGEYNAAGNQLKAYGWKPGSTWGTDPLFMKVGGDYYYYHNDHLGTPQKMVKGNGEVVWSAIYSSFGEAQVLADSVVTNNLRFAGQYYDQETGLHYNYHRYYDPSIGRYLTPDPIGLAGGLNLYSYVQNNPVNFIDPLGLAWFRPQGHKYVVGRPGNRFVQPGKGIGRRIDDYVPAGHTFGANHDTFVGWATSKGAPDWLVNIPSMHAVYAISFYQEFLNSVWGVFGVDLFEHELLDVCK